MQWDRWELADVFDGSVPRETVIEVRHDANVDTCGARLLHQAQHQLLLCRDGEEDLIDE